MDENGDPGLHLVAGSSPTFTVCIVVFPDLEAASRCQEAIRALRGEFGVSGNQEFHFCKRNERQRFGFLNGVLPFPFRYYAYTIDKAKGKGVWYDKDGIYIHAGIGALNLALPNLLDARLVFDATSSKAFDRKLLRALRQHAGYYAGTPVIKDTSSVKSHKSDLIQLVDMVCGSICHDTPKYAKVIRSKEGGRGFFTGT